MTRPEKLSVSGGYVFALPQHPFEVGEHGPFGTGILAEASLGLGGAKIAVGYSAVGGAMVSGSAKAVVLRTWKDPWGVDPNVTLIGPELTGRLFVLQVSIGYLFSATKTGGNTFTIGIGLGG